MSNEVFQFKQFTINQSRCAMKVGTDGVLLGAWAQGGQHILDIGTGTGLIALMMAQRFKQAQVLAIDIDKGAYQQATSNIAASPFANRIKVWHTAAQTLQITHNIDSIVSNPPYFTNSLRNANKQRSIARHTDTLSYTELCEVAANLLSKQGTFSVILPTDNVALMEQSALYKGLYLHQKHFVKTIDNKPAKRCLLSFVKQRPQLLDTQTFAMFDAVGNKTEWYKKLTQHFYLI